MEFLSKTPDLTLLSGFIALLVEGISKGFDVGLGLFTLLVDGFTSWWLVVDMDFAAVAALGVGVLAAGGVGFTAWGRGRGTVGMLSTLADFAARGLSLACDWRVCCPLAHHPQDLRAGQPSHYH